ncbi:uncharacterized protein LOC107001242 [Solanum pennellii]|uniref:Uncharacterized protein LOC107001242 n=1 Tax=Solanum pennellii TaxID=28526 RepID=A0ABM1FCE8_SOLPN|nr:uncharacterized protein LOC107001242 [Solanum pennellii]
MEAEEEERREEQILVQQGQVLVLLQHQLNHNQAQREDEVDQEVIQNSATGRERGTGLTRSGRGRGTETGNGTRIGVAADCSGPTRRGRGTGTDLAGRERGTTTSVARRERGRGTGVAATGTDVAGATRGGKRTRMVGMGILHTQNGFTIHNITWNAYELFISTGHLGHYKQRSDLKWKGKADVTQQGLQEMRENKRRRTRCDCISLIFLLSLFETIVQPVVHYFNGYSYAVVTAIM